MYHLLEIFSHWLQNTPFILWVAESNWAYPYVQLMHFAGLSLWVGTNIALDLRLMGIGSRQQSPGELSDALFLWNWIGLAVAITGGVILFGISAGGYIVNPAFRLKLGILIPLGLILHIVVQQKVRGWSAPPEIPGIAKLAGLTEFLLWLAVATAAIAIPYF